MALRLLALAFLLLSAVYAQEEGGEGEGGGEEENGREKIKIMKIINTMLSTVVNLSVQPLVKMNDIVNLSRVEATRVREVIDFQIDSVLQAPLLIKSS